CIGGGCTGWNVHVAHDNRQPARFDSSDLGLWGCGIPASIVRFHRRARTEHARFDRPNRYRRSSDGPSTSQIIILTTNYSRIIWMGLRVSLPCRQHQSLYMSYTAGNLTQNVTKIGLTLRS